MKLNALSDLKNLGEKYKNKNKIFDVYSEKCKFSDGKQRIVQKNDKDTAKNKNLFNTRKSCFSDKN